MSQQKIITLLTDFGESDVYVGVMKGIIAQINPEVMIIDLTHNIPRQNIAAARFCLMNAYSYFPPNTIHIGVVDPGVGSRRRSVAIKFPQGYLVGPDNGIFSGILNLSTPIEAVELTNSKFWRTSSPSFTFHGRDIFAPVGAYLSTGLPLEALGSHIPPQSLVNLEVAEYQLTESGIIGTIQYIDIFGNLITNIPAEILEGKFWYVKVGTRLIPSGKTYSNVDTGELISLLGSHGWLEIAVNGGNAQQKLELDWGNSIEVFLNIETI